MNAKTKIELIDTTRNKYASLHPFLNEKAQRLWAATEAKIIGWGGQSIVHEATGLDFKTIKKGLGELSNIDNVDTTRIRRSGGGRKKSSEKDKTLLADLERLVDPLTRGDPESPLRWTCKSSYKLAKELDACFGHRISQRSVCTYLSQLNYSLQSNRKRLEGSEHGDRDAQFRHINTTVETFLAAGCPSLSVDTKKKESIGNFKNNGQDYRPKGQPVEVNVHDFPDKKLGKVAPYGVYDIGKNKGWVSVGISSDTAAFAVNTIRSWWYKMGQADYAEADDILITADCGGSNGYRVRLWKTELQKLADELGKVIHVCHFPPGTSKWNKIEHRMFSYISKNWRGEPLISYEAVVELIGHTTTLKGLKIQAQLDENDYEKGLKISDEEMSQVNIEHNLFHGEWNYRILPRKR